MLARWRSTPVGRIFRDFCVATLEKSTGFVLKDNNFATKYNIFLPADFPAKQMEVQKFWDFCCRRHLRCRGGLEFAGGRGFWCKGGLKPGNFFAQPPRHLKVAANGLAEGI